MGRGVQEMFYLRQKSLNQCGELKRKSLDKKRIVRSFGAGAVIYIFFFLPDFIPKLLN